jgi:hypothetical protein
VGVQKNKSGAKKNACQTKPFSRHLFEAKRLVCSNSSIQMQNNLHLLFLKQNKKEKEDGESSWKPYFQIIR